MGIKYSMYSSGDFNHTFLRLKIPMPITHLLSLHDLHNVSTTLC